MKNDTLKRFVILLSLVVITFTGVAQADEVLVASRAEQKRAEQRPEVAAMLEVLAELATKWPKTWYPKGKEPETQEQRDQRLSMAGRTVASAISKEPTRFQPADAAALVLAVWFHESNGEYYVHAGGKSALGSQDNGRAKCFGQIQTWPGNTLLTPEQHAALPGLDQKATERCAEVTLRYFWYHAQRCLPRHDWSKPLQSGQAAQLFAAYGDGKCVPVGGKAIIRAHTWSKARMAIQARLPQIASKTKKIG